MLLYHHVASRFRCHKENDRFPFTFPLASVNTGIVSSGLEVCDPPHRLMVSMVSGYFSVFAELMLPGLALLCGEWTVLQAVATVPLLLLLSYW
ncbi:putative solute carrier family 22 member 31, partial [Tachysurus ichikawai]